ncbi:hypothetical protein ACFFX0_28080 [Citricoccus parietis]|uniref:Uncharacterized protein n=1 Tax=Citricoccus parietis TaxID=592307 RepID=A0ABV5G8B1_9MICC
MRSVAAVTGKGLLSGGGRCRSEPDRTSPRPAHWPHGDVVRGA